MKRNILIVFVLFVQTIFGQNFNIEHNTIIDSNLTLKPENYHKIENQIITQILTKHHYEKQALTDSLSRIIFDNYISSYDNGKLYFLQSDIDKFAKYKEDIDSFLLKGNLDFAFDVFNLYKKRLNQRIKYIDTILENEFDYNKDEYITIKRKDAPWAKSVDELNDLWRKRLKNDALNKKLSGSDWETIKESLKKRYRNYHKLILQYKPEDVFQLYLNAYASAIDPHTNYLSPRNSEQFDISMKLSLEGIGATLRVIDDYTTIMEIIAGGPAYKSDDLHPDDRIIAVAQGDTSDFVDVIGWRIDDTVQLIRGKKGTVVRLKVLRADASLADEPDTVRLVRDKVKLEERSASKDILNFNDGTNAYRIGVIHIPSFYMDFGAKAKGEKDYKSTTRDVRRLLKELDSAKVDGVIVDLRNNGGGSLQEAIELTGLFIEEGPVVQVRNSKEKIEVGRDPDKEIIYDGPMAVMVNRYSASASEIFSGAIQDYGRGIIIGEQTFGKGSVQNLVDLKRFVPVSDNSKIGKLKLTIAKYYRINGHSTQNKGVIPDIKFPSAYDPDEYGESAQPSTLPWDEIQSAKFEKLSAINTILPQLKAKYENRIKDNIEFQFIKEDIAEYNEKKDKEKYSLNESVRKAEREKAEKKKEERKKERKLKLKDKEEVNTKEDKKDDPLLMESGRILSDFITFIGTNEFSFSINEKD